MGDKFEIWISGQAGEKPSPHQGLNLLPPVLYGTWTSVTKANRTAAEQEQN